MPSDLAALSRRCLGKQDLVERLVANFIDSLPRMAIVIEEAVYDDVTKRRPSRHIR